MKLGIGLLLGISVMAMANGAGITNRPLPSPQYLQTNVLAVTPLNRWSTSWTNLTVKKGGCPPWGCSFPSIVLMIDAAQAKRSEPMLQLRKNLRETEVPRLPTRSSFSESFSVSLSHVTNDFRSVQAMPIR